MFIQTQGDVFLVLLVYVDDELVASNNLQAIVKIKASLHDQFWIKNLGPAKYFHGIEVSRSQQGISLCQRKYTLDILSDSGFSGSRPLTIPLKQTVKLDASSGSLLDSLVSTKDLLVISYIWPLLDPIYLMPYRLWVNFWTSPHCFIFRQSIESFGILNLLQDKVSSFPPLQLCIWRPSLIWIGLLALKHEDPLLATVFFSVIP